MISRAIARTSPIRVTYVGERRTVSHLSIVATVVACLTLVLVLSFLNSANQEAREQFMEKLKAQKQAVETNKGLKMELAAITQKGYLEFAARERLGLKRPSDAEVVVLR
jgi:hypothetical protein